MRGSSLTGKELEAVSETLELRLVDGRGDESLGVRIRRCGEIKFAAPKIEIAAFGSVGKVTFRLCGYLRMTTDRLSVLPAAAYRFRQGKSLSVKSRRID